MSVSYKTTGIVEVEPNDMAELVTGTLERLGYQNIRYIKLRAEFTAVDKDKELIGRNYWTHHFRLRLSWKPATKSKGSLVSVVIEEKDGSATEDDCKDRADAIITGMQDDCAQAKEVSEWYEPSKVYGEATWADEKSLEDAQFIVEKPESKRLLLTPYDGGRYLALTERSTYQHAIVCGRTGVGKSTGFFIPNLVERTDVNMIVTEATPGVNDQGELYQLTSGYRQQAGQLIYSFNPTDMTSTRINPIDIVRMVDKEDKTEAAEKLAALLIGNAEGAMTSRADPTWDQSEKLLLTSLILHAAAIEEDFGHFGFLRWMILSGVKEVLAMMKKSPSSQARSEFTGWLNNTSANFRFGVLSGLLTKLNPWFSDKIIALTSATDINYELLKTKRFTFYISVPATSKSAQSVGALILNFMLDYLLSNELSAPVSMLLDEFTNFGHIPGMSDRMSIVRKKKVGVVLGFQNLLQLENVYGKQKAAIILDQASCQVYFRQKNLEEATKLSRTIGKTTIEERRTQYDGRVSEQVVGRELVTADELINLPHDTVIILTGQSGPIKAKKFEPGLYDKECSQEPPRRKEHKVSDVIAERAKVASMQEENWQMSAPKDQPSRSEPVEPLNSNLTEEEKDVMNEIRSRRAGSEGTKGTKGTDDKPDFFDLWDM